MKVLWEKIVNFVTYWKQALVVGALGVVMIGAVYFQSTINDTHIDYLQKIHKIEVRNVVPDEKKPFAKKFDPIKKTFLLSDYLTLAT